LLIPNPVKCSRCGYVDHNSTGYCPVCGMQQPIQSSGSNNPGQQNTGSINFQGQNPNLVTGSSIIQYLYALVGWTSLRGIVINIDQPYKSKQKISWIFFIIKTLLLILLLPVILGMIIASFVISVIMSLVGFRRREPGSRSVWLWHLTSIYSARKYAAAQEGEPVRDFRIQVSAGNELLVRLQGELKYGNINIGDDITVKGRLRHGTLIFWRGYNHRTFSEIRVR